MNRTEKQALITSLRESVAGAALVVVTQQSGLTVADATVLRRRMHEAGARYKVSKNRLMRLALEGTSFAGIAPLLKGPTAIAYSKDPVAAAKVVVAFAKQNEKLVVVGGCLGGLLLDPQGVKTLSDLPSLDALRAKLVGLISAPASQVARVLVAPAAMLARVTAAYGAKGEAA